MTSTVYGRHKSEVAALVTLDDSDSCSSFRHSSKCDLFGMFGHVVDNYRELIVSETHIPRQKLKTFGAHCGTLVKKTTGL